MVSKARKQYNDEIDLLELIKTLWDGKLLITSFTLIAISVCVVVMFFTTVPKYISKIGYITDTLPPFYEADKVYADFKKLFYNKDIFEGWQNDHGKTSLMFDDFSNSKVVEGIYLKKNKGAQLAQLMGTGSDSFIKINTNQLVILDDFFNYANYINKVLRIKFVKRAQEELEIINASFKDIQLADINIVETSLAIDRYVGAAEKGDDVFLIQRPTLPQKINFKLIKFFYAGILGGLIGVIFILCRSSILKHKD
jgi:hypothetical protein